jgi:exopolysaccharide biosynthesis operon protein EpsL
MGHLASGSSLTAPGASGKALRRIALALAGAFAATPAFALFNDKVEIWAAENVTRDTNVFRISDDVSPASVGASQRGDTILTTHLGVTVGAQVSLQRFEAGATWFRSNYRTFNNLDFTGHTARALWNYNYENRITGLASYTEGKGLASFSNIQANLKDLVTSRQAELTSAWLMSPRWRADGRLAAVQTEHSSALRAINDIEAESVEAGVSYITPQDNLFGGSARFEHGRAPHGNTLPNNPVFGRPFENQYDQWAVGATTTWHPTAHLRFDGRVEYLRRRYDEFTTRNYEGPAFKAILKWSPTVKLSVDFGALRDMGPPEDIQTSRVLLTGAYIRPKWLATEKITVVGNVEYNVWDYKGDPISGADFTHRQSLVGGSVQWKPFERIWLQAGVNHEKRTSTLRFADYDTNVAFVEGRVGF